MRKKIERNREREKVISKEGLIREGDGEGGSDSKREEEKGKLMHESDTERLSENMRKRESETCRVCKS